MDQKKTLWIVTAAGVFLAVVVLAALILNKPNPSTVPVTASITTIEMPVENTAEQDAIESVEQTIDSSTIENLPLQDESITRENPLDQEKVAVENNSSENANTQADTVIIDLNQVAEEKTSVKAINQAAQTAMETKKQATTGSTIYTASASEKTQAEIAAEKKAAALNAASKKTTKVEKKVEAVEQAKYWVQCASYTSKKSADNARFVLDEKRIPAEVFTYKDSKDKLYYRVRVGPYTTKSEAEYWKNRICSIETFVNSNSYITVN